MGRNALTEVISANMLTSGFTDDTTIHTSGARNTTARKNVECIHQYSVKQSAFFNSHSRSSSQSRSIKRRLSAMDTNTTIRKKTTAMADA